MTFSCFNKYILLYPDVYKAKNKTKKKKKKKKKNNTETNTHKTNRNSFWNCKNRIIFHLENNLFSYLFEKIVEVIPNVNPTLTDIKSHTW